MAPWFVAFGIHKLKNGESKCMTAKCVPYLCLLRIDVVLVARVVVHFAAPFAAAKRSTKNF